jgi:hypothetical protein
MFKKPLLDTIAVRTPWSWPHPYRQVPTAIRIVFQVHIWTSNSKETIWLQAAMHFSKTILDILIRKMLNYVRNVYNLQRIAFERQGLSRRQIVMYMKVPTLTTCVKIIGCIKIMPKSLAVIVQDKYQEEYNWAGIE